MPRLRRRRLPGVPPLGLDRGRRRRHGRSEAVRVRRLRPRALQRLRLRLGARAHRDAPPRVPRPARALAQRPPLLEAVLMRAPLSWLREYVRVDATAHEIARRLAVSSLEVERVIDVGVADDGRQPLVPAGRQGGRRRQAPERRQAPALPGRRGGGRAAADRLRRLELRRRGDRRRRASRRAPARASRRRSTSGRCAASSRAG